MQILCRLHDMQLREIKKSQGFPITLGSLIREYCIPQFGIRIVHEKLVVS